MDESDFKSLLIRNIGDLDKTCKRIDEIEKQIFDMLSTSVEHWAEDNGWIGEFEWDKEVWIAKETWRVPNSKQDEQLFNFWFDLEVGANDLENYKEPYDYFYTTRLCGAGNGTLGLRFKQAEIIKKKAFKRLTLSKGESFANTALSFDNDGSLYLRIKIDQSALAEAFANEELQTAFAGVSATLNTILAADEQLEALIEATRMEASSVDRL